ncbi:MAG: hypothetical protein WDZ59_12465 [Pirellulales bacterium]
MELRDALCQVSEIRRQMARSEVFRGYRSLTVAASGGMALIAAAIQPVLIPAPASDLGAYLSLWIAMAAISILIAGTEMWWRARQAGPGLSRQMTLLAVEQFIPSIVAGGLLTLFIYRSATEISWMLPGLWAVLFSLGIFASCRWLPRPVFAVGAYYFVCGFACLVWGHGSAALSPWQMGVSFGGGQMFGAAVLYWTLERTDATKT